MTNSWPSTIFMILIAATIGFGAGKMSKPSEETTKSTTSVVSSDQSTASNTNKTTVDSAEKKSVLKALTYYPNGQLKSSVEKSVESVEKHYQQEITDLKIQIHLLESRSTYEHTVKNDLPKNMVTALGSLDLEKGGLYQRQALLPNLFLGGGLLKLQSEDVKLLSATYLF